MSNALFVINLNNHVCQNVRESFQDAANRWKCDYVEITEKEFPPPFPFPPQFTKLKAFELCDADRIMCIDADCIIWKGVPSPFETFSEYYFTACQNKQPHMGSYIEAGRIGELNEFERIHAAGFPQLTFDFDNFFNSGMWVGTRSLHAKVLSRALEIGLGTGTLHWWDQAALNYAIAESHIPIHLASRTWNFCLPNFPPWDKMEKYIYHFAGRPERYELLPIINWRLP